MPLSESQVKEQIIDYLKLKRIPFWHNIQNRRSIKGISDLSALYKGNYLAIEIKAEKGNYGLTDEQKSHLKEVARGGGIPIVPRKVYTVINVLKALDFRKMRLK